MVRFSQFSIIRSHSVHFGLIRSILRSIQYYLIPSVYFNPFGIIRSIQSYLIYSVHFGPMLSTLVHCNPSIIIRSASFLFSPIRPISSTSMHSVLFGLLWSYLIHSVHIGPIRPIQSTSIHSVLFSPLRSYSVYFGSIRSTLVLFGPHWSYSVDSVHFGPLQSIRYYSIYFGSIRSNLVLFGPFCHIQSIRSTLVLFCPCWPYLIHSVHFGPIWSNLFNLVYINIRSVLVRLNLSESFFKHKGYEHRNVIFRAVTHLF